MHLRQPTLLDKDGLLEYVKEHHDNSEMNIHASNMLPVMKYESWIEKLLNDQTAGDNVWGISETYLAVDEDRIIGLVNIRYTLCQKLAETYGHIGLGVRPSERRRGYASCMLKQALLLCKDKGMDEVILGCYKDNIGSRKTIETNKGVLYKETTLDDKPAVYYKIKL